MSYIISELQFIGRKGDMGRSDRSGRASDYLGEHLYKNMLSRSQPIRKLHWWRIMYYVYTDDLYTV